METPQSGPPIEQHSGQSEFEQAMLRMSALIGILGWQTEEVGAEVDEGAEGELLFVPRNVVVVD